MRNARTQPPVALARPAARDLTVPVLLAFAALAVNLTISGNLLFLAGIPYDTPGGNPAEKLHPGTYCAVMALLALGGRHGIRSVLTALPCATVFLAMMLLCIVFQAATGGAERVVIYLESFMPAGALAIVVAHATPRARRMLAWGLTALFLLNIAIAVAEAMQGNQWIPAFLVDREMLVRASEFRPTALYDHPLTGAMLCLTGLLLGLALPVPPGWRAALMLAFGIGLLAFGGRAALAGGLAMLGGVGAVALWRRLREGRLRLRTMALPGAALLCAGAVLGLLVVASPVGERLAERFYWDDSAAARGVQWQILGTLHDSEWLFGASRDRVELLVANLGLRYPFVAVENFWLLMFLNLGLLGFPLFLAGFFTLLGGLYRGAGWQGRVLLVTVMAVASSSNSLGRKSNILTVLVPAVLATAGFTGARGHAR